MTIQEFLVFAGGTAIIGFIFHLMSRKDQPPIQDQIAQHARTNEILEVREQLKRLTKESVNATKNYKEAKEKYEKQYHSNPSSRLPPSSDDKGEG